LERLRHHAPSRRLTTATRTSTGTVMEQTTIRGRGSTWWHASRTTSMAGTRRCCSTNRLLSLHDSPTSHNFGSRPGRPEMDGAIYSVIKPPGSRGLGGRRAERPRSFILGNRALSTWEATGNFASYREYSCPTLLFRKC